MNHSNVLNPGSFKVAFYQYFSVSLVISLLFFLKNCLILGSVLLKFVYRCWRALYILWLYVNFRISMSQALVNKLMGNLLSFYLILFNFLIMWRENFINNLCLLFGRRSNCIIINSILLYFFYWSWMKFLYDRTWLLLFVNDYFTSSWRNWILLDENRDRRWSIISRLESLYRWLISTF